jgi:hypothetical protein
MRTGPRKPKSTVLTVEDEAVIVAFRRHTLLPLDDCLYSLQATIPHLTRSSLHRCLQRHEISRLLDEGDKPTRKKFKSYPIGFFHLDIAEVQTGEGKLYLFVAIDRTSKFAFVQLVESANRVTASAFRVALIAAIPHEIHTILTDNGIQFRFAPRYADGPTMGGWPRAQAARGAASDHRRLAGAEAGQRLRGPDVRQSALFPKRLTPLLARLTRRLSRWPRPFRTAGSTTACR